MKDHVVFTLSGSSKNYVVLKRKELLSKAGYIIIGTAFLLGGLIFLRTEDRIFSLIILLASLPNFSRLRKMKPTRTSQNVDYSIFVIDIVLAVFAAMVLSDSLPTKIAWGVIAFIAFLALIHKYKIANVRPN